MSIPPSRSLYLLAALCCAALIGAALVMEHLLGLEPCPLCIMQRLVVISLGVLFLIVALHNPGGKGYKRYALISLLTSAGGMALAIRQLWLQSLPPEEVPACAPPLEYMLESFPLIEVLEFMLSGTGDCAEVQWVFLGLSIPGWTLVAFSGFALFSLYELLRSRPRDRLFS
ncbi:disulfide bond formation protein B [Aestuariirhabdus litorea]|uniref:Disulfide bond formation protein B n=1 Tax=Aestuariirhabdus litorea TaxID=2528527 RepID=A0A3P3VNR6_9GAMM|nr:disulfide bond formation protein B [Aestuariirhabdus litorea]RRJ82463.1 disulfide bond formation protein B [Aestuariirhabdus litorea]RWW92624.1 disulfide bond formation protein B [Endozoicomonadaceae bacterium GTF-13]